MLVPLRFKHGDTLRVVRGCTDDVLPEGSLVTVLVAVHRGEDLYGPDCCGYIVQPLQDARLRKRYIYPYVWDDDRFERVEDSA